MDATSYVGILSTSWRFEWDVDTLVSTCWQCRRSSKWTHHRESSPFSAAQKRHHIECCSLQLADGIKSTPIVLILTALTSSDEFGQVWLSPRGLVVIVVMSGDFIIVFRALDPALFQLLLLLFEFHALCTGKCEVINFAFSVRDNGTRSA